MNKSNKLKYAVLIIVALIVLFPIVYMILNSFMSSTEITKYYDISNVDKDNMLSFHFIPNSITLKQYYDVFLRNPEFLVKFWNSIKLVLPIIIGQVIVIPPAAFALAKLKIPYKNILYFSFIILMLMPYQVTLVPNYIILDKLGLLGSNSSIILPGLFSTLGIVLLTQFMKSIPDNQIEAAKIDGASFFIIYLKIIVPQSMGGIISMVLLTFADCWNMVEKPIAFLKDSNLYPLSTYLSKINEGNIGLAFACGIIYMIPAILIFLKGEKYLINGMKHVDIK